MNASEGIIDLMEDADVIVDIKSNHDDVTSRWDTLCSNIEKCVNRLVNAKVCI